MAELQTSLLDSLVARVAPGGVLLYSVCTFTEEEGAGQISAFLARHPAFHLEAPRSEHSANINWANFAPSQNSPAAKLGPGVLSTWPHRHEADAFFAARMIRR